MRVSMVAAGFTGGEAEELRRAMGSKRSAEKMARIEERLRAGMTAQGLQARGPGADRQGHHVLRGVRLPGVAQRELRAAGLRERLPPSALPRDLHVGAAQPLADGLLPPGDAHPRRAAPRRPRAPHRRHPLAMGLHPRGRPGRPVDAPRAALRGRAARDHRARHRGRARRSALHLAGGLPPSRSARRAELEALAELGALRFTDPARPWHRREALWQVQALEAMPRGIFDRAAAPRDDTPGYRR